MKFKLLKSIMADRYIRKKLEVRKIHLSQLVKPNVYIKQRRRKIIFAY